jgi:hypothetical protein
MKEVRSLLIAAEPMEHKPHGIPFYVDLLEKHKAQRRALSVEEGPPPPVLEPLDVNLPRLDPDEWKSAGEAETAEAVALLHEPIPLEHDGAKLAAALLDRAGGGHELLKAPPLDPKTQAAVLAKAFAEYAKEHPEAAARLGPPPTADELDPVKATESFDAEFAAAFGRENDADAAEPDEPDWTRERVASHAAAGGAFDEQNLSVSTCRRWTSAECRSARRCSTARTCPGRPYVEPISTVLRAAGAASRRHRSTKQFSTKPT